MPRKQYEFPVYVVRCSKGDYLTVNRAVLDGQTICDRCGAAHVGVRCMVITLDWYPTGTVTAKGTGSAQFDVQGALADQLAMNIK